MHESGTENPFVFTDVCWLDGASGERHQEQRAVSHPGQSEVHLQLCHPLPNAGPHAHPKRDEAVGVVLVVAAAGRAASQPALGHELVRVHKLRLVAGDCVVTKMVQSLKRQKSRVQGRRSILAQCVHRSYLLGKPVASQGDVIFRNESGV